MGGAGCPSELHIHSLHKGPAPIQWRFYCDFCFFHSFFVARRMLLHPFLRLTNSRLTWRAVRSKASMASCKALLGVARRNLSGWANVTCPRSFVAGRSFILIGVGWWNDSACVTVCVGLWLLVRASRSNALLYQGSIPCGMHLLFWPCLYLSCMQSLTGVGFCALPFASTFSCFFHLLFFFMQHLQSPLFCTTTNILFFVLVFRTIACDWPSNDVLN